VSDIEKAQEQMRLALEQGKVTFRIGGNPLLYFLPVHAKGDPLAKGLQFGSREALPDHHIRIFIQDQKLVVLLAEQPKDVGTAERHTTLARVPLSVLKDLAENVLPQIDRRFKEALKRTVGILRSEHLRHHGVLAELPFFFRLGAALPFSKSKGTRFECDSLASPPRLVRGDLFCDGAADAGLVIVRRPDGMLTTPVVAWSMPGEHSAVVMHVSLLVVAMRLGMDLLGRLKPYLTEGWLPDESEWKLLVRETARYAYWYPRVLEKNGLPIADLLAQCLVGPPAEAGAQTSLPAAPQAEAKEPPDAAPPKAP
jgi:hypothetical protein